MWWLSRKGMRDFPLGPMTEMPGRPGGGAWILNGTISSASL